MDYFNSTVPIREHSDKNGYKLFTTRALLIFMLFLGLILYRLYPGEGILEHLMHPSYLSAVDYHYSLILLDRQSELHLKDSSIKAEPIAAITQLNEERIHFSQLPDTSNLWLSYIILRTISLTPSYSKEIHMAGLQAMLNYFSTFSNYPFLNTDQLKILARDALAVESASWALQFYDRIIKANKEQSMAFYGEAAKTAQWADQCEASAKLAMEAKERAPNLEDRRYFYFLAIGSLFGCEKYNLALQLADKNLQGLGKDPITYSLLAEYALKANQPQRAQDYIMKLLQIQGYHQ